MGIVADKGHDNAACGRGPGQRYRTGCASAAGHGTWRNDDAENCASAVAAFGLDQQGVADGVFRYGDDDRHFRRINWGCRNGELSEIGACLDEDRLGHARVFR